ncbi:acyl carrier protein [Pedobacter metabolipauper]|uniref:Acyl carrier protein n=1 Tax=Pedobacter metabolipauper TaxID=425513 RepID=A0A4R6SQD1_9SPHI|nr:phosphopantetheine-binding protein [Pedobacter metabolipauper]TDQ06382.1 acyl carrier protein [Pedobacter metabolipauper]
MNKEVLTEKLKAIISTYAQDPAALENMTESTDFITDLKINSANLVDVVLDLEEAFDIVIDNQSMERMLTVGTALEIIEIKLSEK